MATHLTMATHLQQWSFDKPMLATHTQPSAPSTADSSPQLGDDLPDTLRIKSTTPPQDSTPETQRESIVLQDRYLSSEEHLSSVDDSTDSTDSDSDSEFDYDPVVVDATKECKARTMSISRWDKGMSCDRAVLVSYAFVGRPKVVELANECRPKSQQHSASAARLSVPVMAKPQRLSMTVTPSNRLSSPLPPRAAEPSTSSLLTSYATLAAKAKARAQRLSDSASSTSTASFKTALSSQSSSPPTNDAPPRPSTSSAESCTSPRSFVHPASLSRPDLLQIHQSAPSSHRLSHRLSHFAPPTPSSPALSFLALDPYENSTTSLASSSSSSTSTTTSTTTSSTTAKPTPHKRLRSISMKLALAKISIHPKKPQDSNAAQHGPTPPTPSTPLIPDTPHTAPLEPPPSFASPNRLRRASAILRPKSRHSDMLPPSATEAASSPVPALPSSTSSSSSSRAPTPTLKQRLARGADEREPMLVLPPCPVDVDEDGYASFRKQKLRKRKSMLNLF